MSEQQFDKIIKRAYDAPGRVAMNSFPVSRAKQSMQAECDINAIMKKFAKTGAITHLNQHQGDYGNFIGADNYHNALNQILEADKMFQTIPSNIRADFENDAAKYLAFAENPENIEQMRKYGLAPPDQDPINREPDPKTGEFPPGANENAPSGPPGTPEPAT